MLYLYAEIIKIKQNTRNQLTYRTLTVNRKNGVWSPVMSELVETLVSTAHTRNESTV